MTPNRDEQSLAVSELMRRIGLGPIPLNIADWGDRSTWDIADDARVTPEQREAARAVIDAYDPEEVIRVESARRAGLLGDPIRAKLAELVRGSSEEIDEWLSEHVRTVPQARQVLGALLKLLAAPR
jgi:hypothetical protein